MPHWLVGAKLLKITFFETVLPQNRRESDKRLIIINNIIINNVFYDIQICSTLRDVH